MKSFWNFIELTFYGSGFLASLFSSIHAYNENELSWFVVSISFTSGFITWWIEALLKYLKNNEQQKL